MMAWLIYLLFAFPSHTFRLRNPDINVADKFFCFLAFTRLEEVR